MQLVAHIAELWRYPVKSMGGESCTSLELTPDGIAGDRLYAFTSPRAPIGYPLLHSTERTAMLRSSAQFNASHLAVHPPNNSALTITDPALPRAIDPTAELSLIESVTPLTDVRPIALHSTQTISQLSRELGRPFDPRRLRSNIVLALTAPEALPNSSALTSTHGSSDAAAFPEDTLAGHTLQLGPLATVRITERIPRCRIVSLAPETAAADPAILRHLAQRHDARAGIYARPLTPGTLRTGDPVYFLD